VIGLEVRRDQQHNPTDDKAGYEREVEAEVPIDRNDVAPVEPDHMECVLADVIDIASCGLSDTMARFAPIEIAERK
jgi:hypothetical protein